MEQKICKNCEQPIVEKIPPCPLQCRTEQCKSYQVKARIENKPIVWMLGGPGSGKGTQCDKIVEKYHFLHISTGDLLRTEVVNKTERGLAAESIMQSGGLVPDAMILEMVIEAMMRPQGVTGYLIDGYPRAKSQGEEFGRVIRNPDVIIFLDSNATTMTNRLLQRAFKENRADDNEATIKVRLQTFFTSCEQILSLHPTLVHKISAEAPPDEIFTQIERILDPLVCCRRSDRCKLHPPR